ncbi:hypothetical protein ACS5PN_11340 [Roseateles sp. NT4]|uniref:hypothetical protein n=1 Tax=Roseateles sp. NT4 TaxID=3453715 RepID=UPI003EED1FFE
MNARDPEALLSKTAGKNTRKRVKQTRHMKEASVLADLFSELSAQLAAGEVEPAREASHRAHALLEVLAAMDRQDEHPELASPKCDERQQAARAWTRLMRPNADTKTQLRQHFEGKRFSYIRLEPLPPLPEPKPRVPYTGGIYQTVFLPDDPKLARELGLPESYTFRHGVNNWGFHDSLHGAIERKFPSARDGDFCVQSRVERSETFGRTSNVLVVYKERRAWDEKHQVMRYNMHSTTHAETAESLAAERNGKKRKGASKKR